MEENNNIDNYMSPEIPSHSTCCKNQKKKHCNHCLTICNIVLLLGLVGIYVLHFTGIGTTKMKANPNATAPIAVSEGGLKVAYINTDSLMAKYQYALDLEKELKEFQASKENAFNNETQQLLNEEQEYLKTGDKLTLTQQKAKEEEFKKREEQLAQKQVQYTQEIQQKTITESEKMTNAVYNFIRDYNESNYRYDIILSRSFSSSPVLYGNPGMDITNEIIEGLNDEYKNVKGK